MKQLVTITFLLFFTLIASFSQTFVNTDFLSYTKQYAQENLPYSMARPYEVKVHNGLEQFYIIYYEPFFEHQVPPGNWAIFFLKKEYKGLANEPLFKDNSFSAAKYVNDLLINNLPKLLEEFDVYVCQVPNEDLKPFEEGTERGEVITVYYPKENATFYIYKYTPKGWIEINRKQYNKEIPRNVGMGYVKPLALLKIYKYLWNLHLSYKNSQAQITQAKEVISLIEALALNIYDGDEAGYQKNYALLKQKLENNASLNGDSNLLRLVYSVHAVDLIETPVPLKDKKLYSQTRAAINTLYALNGYEFSNPQWDKIYRLFMWYKPQEPNV